MVPTLDNSTPVFITALSLDIRKAFDSVNHQQLLSKLKRFSLHNSAVSLLEFYLTGQAQVMKVNGSTISNTFNIVSGVPQGSILGPLLFNVMVNDLLTMFPNTFTYADDTVIYSIAQNETLSLLSATSLFKKVQMWYTSNCFTINVSKTHVCIFSNRKLSDSPNTNLEKTKFKADLYINILGINLDSHLTFKIHVHQVATATNRLIYLFQKVRSYMNVQSALKILHYLYSPKANVLIIPFH